MILVSACLLGENCKYNGGNNKNEAVLEYLEGKEYIAVCPEVFGGLETPRAPSEISGEKVISKDGADVTKEFLCGAEITVGLAEKYAVAEAILKESSPSCGSSTIYDGTHNGNKIKGMGITAKMLIEMGISVKSEKDIEIELNKC